MGGPGKLFETCERIAVHAKAAKVHAKAPRVRKDRQEEAGGL
jgi:hypothetical protein